MNPYVAPGYNGGTVMLPFKAYRKKGAGLNYPSVYQRKTGFLINPDGTPREDMLYPTNHPGAQGWRADWKGGVTDWPTSEAPALRGFATVN